jgi:hypothetical protein
MLFWICCDIKEVQLYNWNDFLRILTNFHCNNLILRDIWVLLVTASLNMDGGITQRHMCGERSREPGHACQEWHCAGMWTSYLKLSSRSACPVLYLSVIIQYSTIVLTQFVPINYLFHVELKICGMFVLFRAR